MTELETMASTCCATKHCMRISPENADSSMKTVHQLAESLGNAIDAKDPSTRSHSDEVADMVYLLARGMGLGIDQAEILHVAGHLHDIGKIGIPDSILAKPGPLTGSEWDTVRRHPVIGAEIVAPVRLLVASGVRDVILHHHERWDGDGYPMGLKGSAIPKGARIIAVASSVSAMLQNRPHCPAMQYDEALDELKRCSGSQFDPQVAEAFLSCQAEMASLLSGRKD